jgi:hypothetical protein
MNHLAAGDPRPEVEADPPDWHRGMIRWPGMRSILDLRISPSCSAQDVMTGAADEDVVTQAPD